MGNRTRIIHTDGTETSTSSYVYDDIYRITDAGHVRAGGTEEGSQFENYTYDAIGNRQAMANDMLNNFYPGYEIPTASDPDYDYHKDANNNFWTPVTVKWGTSSYDYDYENRLTRVKRTFNNSSTVVDYDYDVFGRRIGRTVTVDGSVTVNMEYLYDNEDIVAVYENGSLVKEFIHGPGIDEPLAIKSGGSWNYYHADGLGSVMALTDGSGAKVGSTYGYDSFGNLVKGSLDKVYSYTGREWDAEAGLYYYRARFYDPEVGRFISKDPIGFDGGDVNLYSYVGQNPVNFVDPNGKFRIQITFARMVVVSIIGAAKYCYDQYKCFKATAEANKVAKKIRKKYPIDTKKAYEELMKTPEMKKVKELCVGAVVSSYTGP